jgi:carbamoylphosphate synthase small subunit
MKTLKERIKKLSDYSQQSEWQDIRKRLDVLNIHDPETKEILKLAREKGMSV